MMNNKRISIKIALNIGDQLTYISCGHMVVEIIKFVAYQRLQIPYTYQWLKQIVNKRNSIENKKESYQSERHFHVASTALKNFDFIIKNLLNEINGASLPEEICIAFGATPVTCKEIYRLLMPTTCHNLQCHSNHIASDQKIQRNIFRNLATSDELSTFFFDILPPTNMYLFLKKSISSKPHVVCTDGFVLVNGFRVPKSCKIVTLDLRGQNPENISCCTKFQIFGDISKNLDNLKITNDELDNDFTEIESTQDVKWFQSNYVMKGFKDCVVNGNSVTNTWLQP